MSVFDSDAVTNLKMPWGKFGPTGNDGHTAITDLPDEYLLWLLSKAENNDLTPSWLNGVVTAEWKRRHDA